jgi:hypothetical protein
MQRTNALSSGHPRPVWPNDFRRPIDQYPKKTKVVQFDIGQTPLCEFG